MRKSLVCITWIAVLGLLLGCSTPGKVKTRLDTLDAPSACKGQTDTLLVFLPGRYDSPQDFLDYGFVSALRQRRIAADVVIADAHMGYYRSRQVVRRIHEDLILPAQQKAYRQIWLVGISLGGYGSLLYAQHHPDQVQGILLIAPYLGNDGQIRQVADAGGLAQWQAPAQQPAHHDQLLWSWLQAYSQSTTRNPNTEPLVYIGYGLADRFADSNALLARALPAERSIATHGGHAWRPWQRIWQQFLDRDILPYCK